MIIGRETNIGMASLLAYLKLRKSVYVENHL